MNALNKVGVLFVGAGPASLAGAIRLKQLLNQKGRSESVVVIEKADKLGQHNLSGAVFEADVLDELIPDHPVQSQSHLIRYNQRSTLSLSYKQPLAQAPCPGG